MTTDTTAARDQRARDLTDAKAWLCKRWCQDHPNSQHVIQLADYAAHLRTANEAGSQPREGGAEDRFWLIVREPGMVPDRKGPWPHRDTARVLREFIAARPRAFLDVLTVDADGTPWVEHGPQALQIADGRSMSVGSKHNARVRAAAEDALSNTIPESTKSDHAAMFARVRANAERLTLEAGDLHDVLTSIKLAERAVIGEGEHFGPGWVECRLLHNGVVLPLRAGVDGDIEDARGEPVLQVDPNRELADEKVAAIAAVVVVAVNTCGGHASRVDAA